MSIFDIYSIRTDEPFEMFMDLLSLSAGSAQLCIQGGRSRALTTMADEFSGDWNDLDDWEEFIDHVEDINAFVYIPRQHIREREDPFLIYNEEDFLNRYRFRKQTVRDVLLPMLSLENLDARGLPVSPMLKLLTVLRYYAIGSFQSVCGDLHGIAQPTVSKIIKVVSKEISRKLPDFIKFPCNEQELARYKNNFYEMANFPGVIGCIDCTHIPILSPGGDFAELYRNRKGYFSMNVQVVVGPKMEITDIVCRWPGSTHDARIFHNSKLKGRFENQNINGILLGDNGYPQLSYLYTPVIQPTTEAQRRYNSSHIRTRATVERVFEMWKRRFPCLSMKLRTKLTTTLKVILSCAVLHNVAIISGEPDLDVNQVMLAENIPLRAVANRNVQAIEERNAFIQRHFAEGI